jgi:hypothetical protein
MDLSKLPKLSQTPRPADQVEPSAGSADPSPQPPVELYCRCGTAITPGTKFCSNCGASYSEATGGRAPVTDDDDGRIADSVISIAIGAILLFFLKRFLEYYLSPATFQSAGWSFLNKDGAPLSYAQTGFYWSDLAGVAFAIALILEGVITIFLRGSKVMIGVLVVTVAALLLNCYSVTKVVQIHGGSNVQIINLLAIAFGVYIGMYQWATYRRAKRRGM